MPLRQKRKTRETLPGHLRHLDQLRFDAKAFVSTLFDGVRHLAKRHDGLAKNRMKIKFDPVPIPAS
jgi:hypothetical protein